jgi:hypothetical protein
MTSAPSTPAASVGIALFIRMSIKAAIKAPVQAPVPGKGIATKMDSPNISYFCTLPMFFIPLFSILSTSAMTEL